MVSDLRDGNGNYIFKVKDGIITDRDGRTTDQLAAAYSAAKDSADENIMLDNSDNLRDNVGKEIAETRDRLFNFLSKKIDEHIEAPADKAVTAKELLSNNSRHRALVLGVVQDNYRRMLNNINDSEFKRYTVERVYGKAGWSDNKIDDYYNAMIGYIKEAADYAGFLYQEIAIDRYREQKNPGMGLRLRSWTDGERQHEERKDAAKKEALKKKHSDEQGAFSVAPSEPAGSPNRIRTAIGKLLGLQENLEANVKDMHTKRLNDRTSLDGTLPKLYFMHSTRFMLY